MNPVFARSQGGFNVPGKSCWRCGRPLYPEERIYQDGVVVCCDCKYDHNKAEYETRVSKEWPELGPTLYIGGRTG